LEDNRKMVILQVLSRAAGGAPLGYITKHSGITDVFELLNELEDEGCIQHHSLCSWSLSLSPVYEITKKGYSLLENFFVKSGVPENNREVPSPVVTVF
jgi:hypothetical protein